MVLPRDAATAFCREMDALGNGNAAWIVGVVVEGNEAQNTARIMPDARVIRVPLEDKADELW